MTLPVIDFLRQKIKEVNATQETRPGSPTYELLMKPLAIIQQSVNDEYDQVAVNQSLKYISEQDAPNDYDETVVDALAANTIVDREEGNKSSVIVYFFFLEPLAITAASYSTTAYSEGGLNFLNKEAVNITEAQMLAQGYYPDTQYYYFSATFEAEEEGESYNVDANQVIGMNNSFDGLVLVDNPTAAIPGSDRETNLDLIDKIRNAISVRDLNTGKGINATLTENFGTTIKRLQAIGFKDAEMMRDVLYNVHVGGHTDIHIKTPTIKQGSFDVVDGLLIDNSVKFSKTLGIRVFATNESEFGVLSIDSSDLSPVVQDWGQNITYAETLDYIIDDINGTIKRVATGLIPDHQEEDQWNQLQAYSLNEYVEPTSGNETGFRYVCVRAGVSSATEPIAPTNEWPTTVGDQITDGDPTLGVIWECRNTVGFNLKISFEYNPIVVDVRQTARSGREDLTITDLVFLRVREIETLDPDSLQPTGTMLDEGGGYGEGLYGVGNYSSGGDYEWRHRIPDPHTRFSMSEESYVEFQSAVLGYNVRIHFDYVDDLSTIQTFVDNENERVMCASTLVKHFLPAYVDFDLEYSVNASDAATLTESVVLGLIEEYIEGFNAQAGFEISDFIKHLYDLGLTYVKTDLIMYATIHLPDGSRRRISSNNILTIPDEELESYTDRPVSSRITHYLPGTINVTRV